MQIQQNPDLIIQFVLLIAITVFVSAKWKARFLSVFLVVSIFFNKLIIPLDDLNLRFDFLVCTIYVLTHFRRRFIRNLPPPIWLAFVLVAWFAIISMVNSSSPLFSLQKLSILALYALTSMVFIRNIADQGELLDFVFGPFLGAANVVLTVSLLGFALYPFGVDIGFVRFDGEPWLEGPMAIANVFGSVSAVVVLLNLVPVLFPSKRMKRHPGYLLSSGVCVFLSYTRAAWILVVFFGFIVWLVSFLRNRAQRRRPLLVLAICSFVGLALYEIGPQIGYGLKQESLVEFEEGSGLGRIVAMEEGIQDWLRRPIVGNGFQEFEYLTRADRDPGQIQSISLFLQLLQYGGLIAAGIFLGGMVMVHLRLFKIIEKDTMEDWPAALTAVLCLDLLIVAYQITSGIWLPFFWFILFFSTGLVYRMRGRVATPDAMFPSVLPPQVA